MERFDIMILKALRRTTEHNPLDIVGIIANIDARERIGITHKELEDGLCRLLKSGQIQESRPLHFFLSSGSEARTTFSGVTENQYRAAYQTYKDMLQQVLDEQESDAGPLVVCHLTSPASAGFSDEAEAAVEDLADQMEAALPDVANADVIGFENSFQDSIQTKSILIYGAGTNSEVDLIYNAVAPLFRAFPCQPGSFIVRHYDNSQREIVSDLIADLHAEQR